ncbi:hypothetical protein NDU88_002435 [Pleurodeles waltl]|uniref:Uncharacterized protein n=1 Tax=Pleurodeles waltl TaxID=8319 RepID=A0AAV7W0N1_PLEWA|nr:hypothetical protein NDU88_002435 [Pleurodeles waltl]
MGRTNPKQKWLKFDPPAGPTKSEMATQTSMEVRGTPLEGTAVFVAELYAEFRSIDAWLDTRLERMHERLDHQHARIEEADSRISSIENESAVTKQNLEKVEHMLNSAITKNEALEMRSCQNNIWIVGVSGTVNMGHYVEFVDRLLTDVCS